MEQKILLLVFILILLIVAYVITEIFSPKKKDNPIIKKYEEKRGCPCHDTYGTEDLDTEERYKKFCDGK